MSYKEKPILKLYKYENNSFIMQAQIDDYQETSFEDNLYEAGQFSITINFNIPNAQLFQRGLFIQFGNSWKFGEISKIEDQIGENGKGSQFRIITGYDARYILKRRVIKNMNSNGLWVMTGKGEIVLRNLINDQAGTNAEQKRKLPIINTIPNSENAIGKEYSASEQFSNLYEVCKTIATQSEIGWRLEFNGTNLNLVCFQGTDRTQIVQFSTSFDSLADGKFTDSSESFANAIYVGGKGQNDDRDIYEGESAIEESSPSGLDRFECWDNQSSMTTESEYETEALSMLNQYGQTLTMSGNGLAKCPYEYEKEYFVGDKIKIAFSGKSANAQILSVTEHWAWGNYEINFSFGKPLPDLNAQLQLILKQIQKASNKNDSTDSVRWYTIPTDTEMPKADVTYNTIGFIGNAGSGATFKLYLDDEKTGAKSYHVWFKQLAGTGKLTLTTGKSGAVDLSFDVGTYVAIISVDENGNIINVASTPTNIIQSGNNQPVTSDGVANYTPSHATNADYASNSGHAISADSATNATNADYASNSGHAISADSATSAGSATSATNANYATSAGSATNATNAGYATSAGSAISASSASNAGALEGKTWRETALSGLYVTDNTSFLSGASYTFSPSAPVGSAELAVGSTVKVTFANPLQSSTAITSVNFNYGGRNGQIVAARQNTLVGLTSHLFQGGEFSAQHPNKVWDSYTTLKLMWTGSYWLVMDDTILCSYFSDDGSCYVVKANGLLIHTFTYFEEGRHIFPVVYSNINYKVIGGATVIDGIARRQCVKHVGFVDFGSEVRKWTTEDMFVIGY